MAFLALVWVVIPVSARPAQPAVLDPRTVHSATLDNGLRLIVCQDPEATVLSVEVTIRTGSADDPSGQEGIAHLLEHVLWSRAGQDDPRRRIEEIGGVVIAGVLRDFTRFYLTVPDGYLELAVDALADLTLPEDFSPSSVLRESAIIEEESLIRLEQPRAVLSDCEFEELYGPDHPYGRPTDGDVNALRRIGPAALSLFHQTWYRPNNMAVIVAGNVGFEQAQAAVDSGFRHLTPAALPARPGPPPDRPPKGRERTIETPLDQAYVMAVFVGPAAFERTQVCASDLIATLLVHPSSGRLSRELQETRQLASSVGVDFLTQRDRALVGVWVACDPDDIPAVKDVIRGELRRLSEERIPVEEFAAVRRLLAAGFAFANETPSDRAATLAFYEAIDTYRTAAQYLPRVRALTPADVFDVAGWYAGNPVWVVLSPKAAR
ncbi:MAG: insulinase family protein [Armatimonadetes bacterium]|nr:insulinase family protein [Armatimonadota bacterium]